MEDSKLLKMKKVLCIIILALTSSAVYAQTSQTGRVFNVRSFGAKCDASTDDLTAIAAAITAATATGGVVEFPEGTCVISSGITVPGGVTLRGKGKYVSIIKSSVNGVIVNLVAGSGTFAFLGPKVQDLWVDGSDSGASQIGIQVTDTTAVRDVVIENVTISDCGSHGLFRGNVFSSQFKNIYSYSNGGYNFFINSPDMPSNYDYGHYSGDISSASPAGYRIKQGTFICWSCNGINTNAGATGYWAVIGGKSGDIDGDVSAFFANAKFIDCNIEGAKTAGVLNYPGSVPSFEGETTFVGLGASSGSWKAIDYDTDASLIPETSQRGYIADTVVFSNSPITFYSNSQPVHADGNPPVILDGQGLRIAGHGIIGTYYNSVSARAEQINRADGYMGVVSVTATTSFTNPGMRYLEVTCGANCTQSLPSASFYTASEPVTIKNLSATGVVVTINANSGSTVNGSSYSISTTGESVTLVPNGSADWRIVGERFNSGTSPRIPYYSSANKFTTTSGLEFDTGSTVLKSPGRFWAADTSASNPSFSFTNDTDTGFYRPGVNTIGIAANGANVASFGTAGLTLGVAGSVAGSLIFANSTNSNLVTITSLSTANVALSLPATSSDTLVARNTTDTLTNKTLTSPTINGGTHTALTSLGIRSTGTGAFDLTLANSENLTAGRTLTFAVGDAARTLTVGASASVSGTNTGDQTSVSGNAGTATALATARTINGVSFDGTANITVTAAAGTLTGATLASGVTASSLTSFGSSPTIITPTISGAISFPDDVLQTFNPGTTNAGLNVGSIAGDPSTPSNGSIWYDSTANELTARINGANVALGAGGGGGSGTVTHTAGALTANSFVFGNGGDDIKATAAATNGQLLIGSTGANPVAAALTGSSSVTVTNGAGSITLSVPNSGITNAMLAGSITDDKLSQITTADKVADSALSVNVPLLDTTNTFTAAQNISVDDATTNNFTTLLDLRHSTTGVAANFGTSIRFGLESTATANRDAARINTQWTTATDASRTASITFQLVNNAAALATKATLAGNGDFTVTGNLAGVVMDASTGYRIGGAAASGNYLRGNGTNFVSSAIAAGDLPALNGFTDATPALDDVIPVFDTSAAANRDATIGQIVGMATEGFIQGLNLEYVDTNTIRVNSGAAYIQSTGKILKLAANDDTDPSLSASTWYHVYLFDSSGTIDTEVSTTAPDTPFIGTARSKTSDPTRRYVGSFRTNSSSEIINFLHDGSGASVFVTWRVVVSSVMRALSSGTSEINANVDLSNMVPTGVRTAYIRIFSNGNQALRTDSDDMTGTDPDSGSGYAALASTGGDIYLPHPINSSQTMRYSFFGTRTTGGAFIDVYGYYLKR